MAHETYSDTLSVFLSMQLVPRNKPETVGNRYSDSGINVVRTFVAISPRLVGKMSFRRC